MSSALIFLIILVVVASILTAVFQGKSAWSAAFEKIALRYGGTYAPVRMLRLPAAGFSYKRAVCRVRCVRRRFGQPRKSTEFRIAWPFRPARLEIRQAGRPSRIRGLRNARVVEIDDTAFARRFTVVTNNVTVARTLMSPGVCWQLDQLQRTGPDIDLHVAIDKGWLTVTRTGYIVKPEPLDDFVRYSLELFDQLMLTTSVGIEFHDHIIPAVEQMLCPVCSCDIQSQMVICVRCKTPHCHDCWLYNGKCGMYACNETRYSMVGGSNVST